MTRQSGMQQVAKPDARCTKALASDPRAGIVDERMGVAWPALARVVHVTACSVLTLLTTAVGCRSFASGARLRSSFSAFTRRRLITCPGSSKIRYCTCKRWMHLVTPRACVPGNFACFHFKLFSNTCMQCVGTGSRGGVRLGDSCCCEQVYRSALLKGDMRQKDRYVTCLAGCLQWRDSTTRSGVDGRVGEAAWPERRSRDFAAMSCAGSSA